MIKDTNIVITEDSNSGFQFFSAVCRHNLKCISAGGNAGVVSEIRNILSEGDAIIVIADGAAFGAFMHQTKMMMDRDEKIVLFLPESFEWLILKSGLIDGNHIRRMLESPEDYVESSEYFSWEQFFTDVLEKETKGTYLEYKKDRLNGHYLQPEEAEAVLKVLPEVLRSIFSVRR